MGFRTRPIVPLRFPWRKFLGPPPSVRRCTGKSLSYFCVNRDASKRAPPDTWPVLDISPDRHSCNISAFSFLCRQRCLNSWPVFDMAHGSWDDEKLTIGDLGLRGWLMMLLITLNVCSGPFKTDRRYIETCEAVKALWRKSGPQNHPAFQEYVNEIVEKTRVEASADDADVQA